MTSPATACTDVHRASDAATAGMPAGTVTKLPEPVRLASRPRCAQRVVGRGDGGPAEPQRGGQFALGRQPGLGGDPPVQDQGGDRRRPAPGRPGRAACRRSGSSGPGSARHREREPVMPCRPLARVGRPCHWPVPTMWRDWPCESAQSACRQCEPMARSIGLGRATGPALRRPVPLRPGRRRCRSAPASAWTRGTCCTRAWPGICTRDRHGRHPGRRGGAAGRGSRCGNGPGLGTMSNVVAHRRVAMNRCPDLAAARPHRLAAAHRLHGRRHRCSAASPPACTSAPTSAPARATA